MSFKTVTVIINDEGTRTFMKGSWSRKDLDTARLAMVKKMQEHQASERLKTRSLSDGDRNEPDLGGRT